uniref:Major facilitator superfamily (MFS) profile domain-containing protein n=1 Tax=Laticauda laticaudata TaxID=8630 RepID=A0A8C5SD49_LATLA
MILVLGIGGSFPYGFHISVINYPSMHIKKFINETWLERHGSPLPQENVILLWSFIVSSYGIGGLVGSVCCGYLTTKYRKKKCQMFTNLIMLMAALFMGFSKMAKSFEMILLGRLLYGIGIGFSFNIHPQYVGEISPKKLRGFTNATVAVFLTLGKVAGQIIGLGEILGSESLWPLLLAFSGLTAAIQLVTLPCFPDSPSYLLIQKGNEEAFLKGMRIFLLRQKGNRAGICCYTWKLLRSRSQDDLFLLPSETHLSSPSPSIAIRKPFSLLFPQLEASHEHGLCHIRYSFSPSLLAGATISVMVEIFNQTYRPSAFVIVGFINWMGLFLLGMIFPFIVEYLGPFCFLIFIGILAVSSVIIYLYLPETKGKSILEITMEFNKLNYGKKQVFLSENRYPKETVLCTKL